MMDAYRCIITKRDTRAYADKPIPAEALRRILQAGRMAGSSKNTQPWRFVLLEERAKKEELAACGQFAGHVPSAPVLVAIVMPSESRDFDAGRCAQNMMLAAHADGITSCPVADLGPAEARPNLRRDCRHVLRAPTWEEATARYQAFRSIWSQKAPESCHALAEGFEEAMLPLLPEGPRVPQRTNGLAERMAREFRRFLKPREALRSARTAGAYLALAVNQINARHRHQDWLPSFLGAAVGLPQRLTQFRIPLHT